MTAVAPDYVLRIASLGTVTGATDSEADVDGAIRGRTTEALAAINVFVDHPVVGVGPNRFFREFSQIEANKLGLKRLDTNRRAHNLYLELAADQGVLGLGAFGLIMGTTIVQLLAARRRWIDVDPDRAELAADVRALQLSHHGVLPAAVVPAVSLGDGRAREWRDLVPS